MENTDEPQMTHAEESQMNLSQEPKKDEGPSYSKIARIGFFSSGIGLSAATLALLLVLIIQFMAIHTHIDFPGSLANLAGFSMILSLVGLVIGGILCFKLHIVSYFLGILICLVQLVQFIDALQKDNGIAGVSIYLNFSLWTILLFVCPLARLAAKTIAYRLSKFSLIALAISLLCILFNLITSNANVKADSFWLAILDWTNMIGILLMLIASTLGAITYFKLFKPSSQSEDPAA